MQSVVVIWGRRAVYNDKVIYDRRDRNTPLKLFMI